MSSVELPRPLANQLLQYAQTHAEQEVCGIISSKQGVPYHCYPVANTAAEPQHRFDMDEAELNNSQSAERLADGQLDAYFYAAGWPVAAMVQLASTKGMSLHSFSEADLAKINEIIPAYIPSKIPGGVYEGIDNDVLTPAVSAMLVVSSDLSDELVYGITKALWNSNTRKLLDNGHAKGKQITVESALDGVAALGVPLHAGAERFYKEAGLLK